MCSSRIESPRTSSANTSRLPTTSASEIVSGLSIASTGSARSNPPGQRQLQARPRPRPRRQHVNRPAAVVHAVQHPLLFQVGDVLVHGGQALQAHAARNLFKRRRIAIAAYKRLQKIQNFLLSSCNGHARIIANKKRTATIFSPLVYFLCTLTPRVPPRNPVTRPPRPNGCPTLRLFSGEGWESTSLNFARGN